MKQHLRSSIKNQIGLMNVENKNKLDELGQKELIEFITNRSLDQILIYSSLPDEISTKKIISQLQKTKNIYLPKVVNDHQMSIHAIKDWKKDLIPGRFGILEPNTEPLDSWLDEVACIIVPARAIDFEGNRLGRGKGYYDNILKKASKLGILIVGYIYHFQWVTEVPVEEHDVPVSFVVTEKGTFQIRK